MSLREIYPDKKDGKRRKYGDGPGEFDVSNERELFYGFTRKNNVWYSTSCTLNSWIEALSRKEVADVVLQAGVRGSDKS